MAKYEVKVDLPNQPKGDEVSVPDIGMLVKNGSTHVVELDDETFAKLDGAHGIVIKHHTESKKKEGGEN